MNLLFVCTGNTCRSPMAEGIARHLVAARQLDDVHVQSAGTFANVHAPASDGSLLVAMEQGIDISQHRAQELTPQLVQWADVILTMGPHHRETAEEFGGAGKTHLLTSYAANDNGERSVGDPFGGTLSVYRDTFKELTTEIASVLDRVVRERDQPSS